MTDYKLDKNCILSFCHQQHIPVDLLETTDSTSEYLHRHAGRASRICIAEQQTAGRGQKDRQWYSPAGVNIYFSYRHVFSVSAKQPDMTGLGPLVCSVVRRVIQDCMPDHVLRIRWPNDILCENKKLAGILTEIRSRGRQCVVIIGIGINVNMLHDPAHPIDQPWTSIREVTGRETCRNYLCAQLIDQLVSALPVFPECG